MAKPKKKPTLAVQDDQVLLTAGPERDALLDKVKRSGAKWVRANVEYSKTSGGTNLQALDGLVDAAKARGIRVQATLMSDPHYANQGALNWRTNDPKVWSQFAKTVAAHEKGRIGRYSVGNEMNLNGFNQGAQADPRQAGRKYRNVYRSGQQAIQGADPNARVLFGEMTSGGDVDQFLKGVFGGKRLTSDGFAYHPYKQGPNYNIDHLPELQAKLKRYANQRKFQTAKGKQVPLYATEFGYQRGVGTDAQRVAKTAKAYSKATKAGAREFLQYQLTDKTTTAPPAAYGVPAKAPTLKWDTSLDINALANALKKKRR